MVAFMRFFRTLGWVAVCALSCRTGWAAREAHDDGTRPAPVHRIHLMDERGEKVVPQAPRPMPFSSRTTCGACHDVQAIGQGWHFSEGNPDVPAGRPAQPWIWVDQETGMALPLSGRGRPGTWRPQEIGMTAWEWTEQFGRHMPGPGLGTPMPDEVDMEARWTVSGVLDIHCLACHNASHQQDMTEWAKQMGRQNYRWAATASDGLGMVGGIANRAYETWDPVDGPNLDDSEYNVPPYVQYDLNQFDAKGRAFLDIADVPEDRRCLYCHSVVLDEEGSKLDEMDVHTAAGIRCADCHTNDVKHQTARGYEGESKKKGSDLSSDVSCRQCHLGSSQCVKSSPDSGWFGAPRPEHKKLPALHLDKLSCTACHSGPYPSQTPHRVRTSRANRLGIHGAASWVTEWPAIVAPVFVRGESGKIEPKRMMWPSFWARREGDKLVPLKPEAVALAGQGVLDNRQTVAKILASLDGRKDAEGEAVFLTQGKVYKRNVDGGLSLFEAPGSLPAEGMMWGVFMEEEVSPLLSDLKPEITLAAPTVSAEGDAEQKAGASLENQESLLEEEIALVLNTIKALECTQKAGVARGVAYGSKIYRVGPDGQLETLDKGGPLALKLQWGWLQNNLDVTQPVVFEQGIPLESLGSDLKEDQVIAALQALAGINKEDPSKRSPVFLYRGKILGLGQDPGKLEEKDSHVALPDTGMPWAWMRTREVQPISPAFDADVATRTYPSEEAQQQAQAAADAGITRISECLDALWTLDPKPGEPVCLFGKKMYRRSVATYVEVPVEEASQILKSWEDARVALEAEKEALKVVSFNNVKFYPTDTPGKTIDESDPKFQKLLELAQTFKDRASEAEKIQSFGEHHYREDPDAVIPAVADLRSDMDVSAVQGSLGNLPVWGWLADEKVSPLVPDLAREAVAEQQGLQTSFTEAQISKVLESLSSSQAVPCVYVCKGKVFAVGSDGKLKSSSHPAAEPTAWPLAHEVRPASQSLGAKGCRECHRKDSAFLFAKVEAQGPLLTQAGWVQRMVDLEEVSGRLHRLIGLSFALREWVGAFMLGLCGLVAVVLALYLFKAADRVTRWMGENR